MYWVTQAEDQTGHPGVVSGVNTPLYTPVQANVPSFKLNYYYLEVFFIFSLTTAG